MCFRYSQAPKDHLLHPFTPVASALQPEAKTEERALCRVAEHKVIESSISALKEGHANWSDDLPHIIKVKGERGDTHIDR